MKMYSASAPDRELIRRYFECLKARRTTTESLGKQMFTNFIDSLKQGKLPKQGKWVYIILALFIGASFISPFLAFIVLILIFIIAKARVNPNIKLPVSDAQIDQWLKQDRKMFFEAAADKLGVYITEKSQEIPTEAQNVVIDKPITLSSGYKLDAEDKFWAGQFGQDYFKETSTDNITRYSIHRFMIIYPCRNFLTIYQCYWNFIKGSSHFVETREYLYDTIVSVRNSELSVPTDDGQRYVFMEYLELTTTDGKEIQFPAVFDHHVIDDSEPESNKSRIKTAARAIRQLLRQRRIDIQPVKVTEGFDELIDNSY